MKLYDKVQLCNDLQDHGLVKGQVGAIVDIYTAPRPAYEVEFMDNSGRTVALIALEPSQIAPVIAHHTIPGFTYVRVRWLHSLPDEPVDLWSELDADRFETRKVEIWASGKVGYAGLGQEIGSTRLGLEPLPSEAEIERDPQFKPQQVSAEDFEQVWSQNVR